MSDLQALLARIEAAEGADREIDLAIGLALAGWEVAKHDLGHGDEDYLDTGHMLYPWPASAGQDYDAFTASLDAALALVERVLPGWTMACDATVPEMGIDWELFEPIPDGARFTGTHAKHALALLSALLRALIALSETQGSPVVGVGVEEKNRGAAPSLRGAGDAEPPIGSADSDGPYCCRSCTRGTWNEDEHCDECEARAIAQAEGRS
jgi:hypothetical protein